MTPKDVTDLHRIFIRCGYQILTFDINLTSGNMYISLGYDNRIITLRSDIRGVTLTREEEYPKKTFGIPNKWVLGKEEMDRFLKGRDKYDTPKEGLVALADYIERHNRRTAYLVAPMRDFDLE